MCGDEYALTQLYELGYVRTLIETVGICGGSNQQNNIEINNAIQDLNFYLMTIHEGKEFNRYHPEEAYFPSLTNLIKLPLEQIEQEFGIEEIEALLINKGFYGDIRAHANKVKHVIYNQLNQN
ncbi:MAG: hypothetical protein EZS28_025325 [Streblomastix strix]|uniref:Uncharacterized protein n=1 Tax=Streblomastix strix TaxID=222440 RepID=A0A5J4V9C0_9EUKA|nr:MAG: hypothetical protein EZS28_025325 [Streblomastix strix]